MNEHEPQDELFARLQFLVAVAKEKRPGAELAILVRVTLGQSVSAREVNLTRQGYKRALDALEARKLICRDEEEPQLHPEVCAKYGITKIENNAAGTDLLRKLADGSLEARPERKNLYRCNADGVPASDDEVTVLFENLKDAAVYIASWLGKVNQPDVLRGYSFPQGVSRELHMRGLASIVQGFLDGRLPKAWPGGLGTAVGLAIRSVRPEYPKVLDPHRVLDRFRTHLRKIQDKKAADFAAASQLKANVSKQPNAVPKKADGALTDRAPGA